MLPVDIGYQAQAGDDVANGDVRCALLAMDIAHHRVGRRLLHRQTLVEPGQRRRDLRILIAQPMHELDREGLRKRPALMRRKHDGDRFGRPAARAQQAVGETVRRMPLGAALGDLLREASEILDQNDPQRDRHRPEFADGERLHLLIGSHEANQHLGVEAAIGMGDERPRYAEHPGIARERARRELGKLSVVSGRQVRADLVDLLFDEMIIVDQPFGCGRDGATLVDRLDGGTIGGEQNGPIVGETPRQKLSLGRSRRHDLRDRKTARMVLEAFDAEQFFANGFLAVPRRQRRAP